MKISKKYIEDTLKKLESQKNKFVADINAVEGAIQICNTFILELEKKEEAKEEKGKSDK